MELTCVDIKCGIQGSNRTNVAFVRKDSSGKIIWPNILQPTLKACRIIAQYAIEDSSVKLPCVLISKTNTSDSTTSSKLALYVVTAPRP